MPDFRHCSHVRRSRGTDIPAQWEPPEVTDMWGHSTRYLSGRESKFCRLHVHNRGDNWRIHYLGRRTMDYDKAAQKLQMWASHTDDSTSIKPSLVAFLRRVAISRFRARCSYSAALRSR